MTSTDSTTSVSAHLSDVARASAHAAPADILSAAIQLQSAEHIHIDPTTYRFVPLPPWCVDDQIPNEMSSPEPRRFTIHSFSMARRQTNPS